MMKTCRVCKRKLPLERFVKDRCAALGVKYVCRACYADERKSYPSYLKPRKKGGEE